MRNLHNFYDAYLKYRAKHEMRLHTVCCNPTYKLQIKHFKSINDVRIICNIEASSEEEMYRRATRELINYFEGRRYA